jgi:Ca-activated chloride channel homolog
MFLNSRSTMALTVLAVSLFSAGFSQASQVKLRIATSSDVLLAGQSQKVFLKVSLDGLALEQSGRRAPVNVAIVLDRSGSMSGEKMWKAKEAAKMAISRLSPDDIVSVVAYNHSVDVLVPATKAVDKQEIFRRIDRLGADGNTALFAGVSKGAHEVRKFLDRQRVGRVILVSDGMANVGPSSPGELADLGFSLVKEGVSVTTIGLGTGYNEDLMAALARASDGNHAFAENAGDMARIFNLEFGDLLSVVAREVSVTIRLSSGIKPIRVLGREAQIYGQTIRARVNQLYASQEKFFLIEVQVPASMAGMLRDVAQVGIDYTNALTGRNEHLSDRSRVSFSNSQTEVDRAINERVVVAGVELVSNEQNRYALELRDKGNVKQARKVLEANAAFLDKKARRHKSKKLKKLSKDNRSDRDNLEGERWNAQRKTMRKRQHELDQQQMW